MASSYSIPLLPPNGSNGHLSRSKSTRLSESPVLSIVDTWAVLLSRLKTTTARIKQQFEERARIEKETGAYTDDWCTGIFLQAYSRLEHLTAELETHMAITQSLGNGRNREPSALSPFALSPWQMEERYRALIQLQAFVGSFFERASPAYDHSQTVWWFDSSYYKSDGLNYDRYGSPDIRELETRLLPALGLGEGTSGKASPRLLMTSSGVAAFTVLHQFVMSKVVTAGDTIVVSPYLYFECFAQLRRLSHVKVVNSTSFDAEDIIAVAEAHNARAIYLDPMANTPGLETTDLRRFAQLVSGKDGWANRHLLIDGTLVSGGMPLYNWFDGPHHPRILYYESAHKYIQMGMDMIMCGLLVYPDALHQTMGLIRQFTGTTLYSRQANLLPPIDYAIHQSRMHWLTANAEKLYHVLDKTCVAMAEFNFPTHWRKMGWSHGGNLVTIRLFGQDMNQRRSLDMLTSQVLRAAEQEGVPMTKGGGLGFSITRIWPSDTFIRNEDPYIRISVGVDADQVDAVARSIRTGLERHCRASKSALAKWKLMENDAATAGR